MAYVGIGSLPGQQLSYDGTNGYWFPNNQSILARWDFIEGNDPFQASGGGSGANDWPSSFQTFQHPGVVDVLTSGAAANWAVHSMQNFFIGGGLIWIDLVCKIPTLSNASDRFQISIGFSDNQAIGSTNNVLFQYQDNVNSGKWNLICAAGGVTTTTNTATTTDTNWHRYSIQINAAGSSATFYLDGTSLGTISTNLPANTSSLYLTAAIVNQGASTGASRYIAVDLITFYQSLTTAR